MNERLKFTNVPDIDIAQSEAWVVSMSGIEGESTPFHTMMTVKAQSGEIETEDDALAVAVGELNRRQQGKPTDVQSCLIHHLTTTRTVDESCSGKGLGVSSKGVAPRKLSIIIRGVHCEWPTAYGTQMALEVAALAMPGASLVGRVSMDLDAHEHDEDVNMEAESVRRYYGLLLPVVRPSAISSARDRDIDPDIHRGSGPQAGAGHDLRRGAQEQRAGARLVCEARLSAVSSA